MTDERIKRKLTAILSADVEGYGRLMGENEVRTVRTLEAYRQVMGSLIEQYRGRVVDSPGDNLLAEFASVVDAAQCAVEIQEVLKAKNAELPEDRRMLFRIGINLGDVIEEGNKIYGDGVNIAARVENLAEGGGICISGSAYEQIENKLALGYEYIGEHAVKNIAKPIHVYRVPMRQSTELSERKRKVKAGLFLWVAAALVAVLLTGIAVWHIFLRPAITSQDVARKEERPITFTVKPSLAVLPFENLSGDPNKEHFVDGITDDLITNLSKISGILVAARKSSFAYKERPMSVRQIAKELGVRYVLEGSIRSKGEQVIINAQLIDASTQHHLWADRYDRDMKDLFAVQNEITLKILVALEVALTEKEQAQLRTKGSGRMGDSLIGLEVSQQRGEPQEKKLMAELVFWESIKDSKTKSMFEEYLRQFPNGLFAGLAKIRIKDLSSAESKKSMDSQPPKGQELAKISSGPDELAETDARHFAADTKKSSAVDTEIKVSTLLPEQKGDKTASDKPASAEVGKPNYPIDLAIFPWRFDINIPRAWLRRDETAMNADILEGLKQVLTRTKIFTPKFSYYDLGEAFHLKNISGNPLAADIVDHLWIQKSFFSDKKLDVDLITQLGRQLKVDAILMCFINFEAREADAQIYLINTKTKQIHSESEEITTHSLINDTKHLTWNLFIEYVSENFQKHPNFEIIYWETIKDSENVKLFQEYL